MKITPLNVLLATTFLSTSAMAVTLEPTLDDSFISYSEGTSTDYNFTVQEADADSNLTTKYYKIDIDKDKISTSSNISWLEVDETKKDESNVVAVNLPNNQTKYFQYAYTVPTGYETITESENISVVDPTDTYTYKYVGAAINNVSGNNYGNIDKKVFLNNNVRANLENNTNNYRYLYVYGGAISNQGEIGNIIADFIGNSIEVTVSGRYSNKAYVFTYGGAIYNDGTTGNITGDFIGNHASASFSANGGAIYNYTYSSNSTSTIGNITGDFIGNYVKGTYANGGAIYNYTYSSNSTATIGNITGNFIGNYASGSSSVNGGAICNYAYSSSSTATIGNITGDFIGNYASGSNFTYGGAIYNYAEYSTVAMVGDITSDFIGNYAR
ncbi:MAG: hypothetical protein IKV11_00915, partial [Alphaproteobacteria bacterium]|nr:hypothetical protein [Alphaproteobacteria bacterium]